MARVRALVIGVAVLCGCDRVYGLDRPPEPDAEVPVDAPLCYGTGLVQLCLPAAPTRAFGVEAGTNVEIKTDTTVCEAYTGDPGWCVVSADTIDIDGRLRGSGTLPLVLVATTRLTVSPTGSLDVSSSASVGAGGDPAACPTGLGGTVHSGGGAGGTFGGKGGGGGDAGTLPAGKGAIAAAVSTVTTLRGGCRGGNGGDAGNLGHGGGAVYLISATAITIDGSIDASGGGGGGGQGGSISGGGGGGGSGGMIGLDAPQLAINGSVLANGGGGGEGGGDPAAGMAGARPQMPSIMAAGGAGGPINGGDGGDGAAGASTTGVNGMDATASTTAGGGGGGGGGGILKIYPRQPTGINVSPPAT